MFKIKKSDYENKQNSFTLKGDGDVEERLHFNKINFPKYEEFWKLFVTPATKRIEVDKADEDYIRMRENVDQSIEIIARIHYSIYIRTVQAKYIIDEQKKHFINFEGCFIKLGQICDLVDELLIQIFLLTLKIKNEKPKILSELTEEEFLKICKDFYDEDYPQLYEHYISKGKILPLKIPRPQNLEKEFLDTNQQNRLFKEWATFSLSIRRYRNYFVHNPVTTKAFSEEGVTIPKREKINKISNFNELLQIKAGDYVLAIDEMKYDYTKLESMLNKLWIFILEQIMKIRYQPDFLKLYNIEITDTIPSKS